MEAKRITIRVSPKLHKRLAHAASGEAVSLNSLAVRALEEYIAVHTQKDERLALRELGDLLAPAAEAEALTEEELLRHARQARQRIWQERYEKTIQAHSGPPQAG
jgi:predicted transcriptional regulator